MKLSHGTQDDLKMALEMINKRYNDNIIFNRFDNAGFTLRVKNSKGPGARLHIDRYAGKERRSISACWHVHGDFFDALFEINPKAVIRTGNKKITAQAGNWEDWNIGSTMYPVYYSESCLCGR
jgi:hypothetical protein